MSRGFLDLGSTSPFELTTAKDIATTHDDSNLAAKTMSLFDLSRDRLDLIHADPAFTSMGQAFAAKFQNDTAILRRLSV